MTYPSEAIKTELKEKYLSVKSLLNESNDPDNEPYKSKYAARDILKNMLNLLHSSVDNSKQNEPETSLILGVIYFNLGIIAIDTEELSTGEEHLLNCLDILGLDNIQPKTILTLISTLNQLGILWSKRDEAIKAKNYLENAEIIYKTFKEINTDCSPVSMAELLGVIDTNDPPSDIILEKLHTLTLYYLAQIYGSLEYFLKSAIYCHMTLERQLEQQDFDSIDWALNAATLSQFFMEKECFTQARHHLSAATYILGKYEDALKLETSEKGETEEIAAKWENFKHRSADVSRCWAKYGILLLSMSRDRLMQSGTNDEKDQKSKEDEKNSEINLNQLENLNFRMIASNISNSVTDEYLLDFNDARKVFLNVQKWLDDAKSYYTLSEHASDYVQIIQDTSQAFKNLAFFEENEDRQAKMHKRRIDLLEAVKSQLNEKYYLAVFQEIWIELGETYSEILDIKIDKLKATDERPSPNVLNKINNLTKSAILNFKSFLHSVNILENKIPENLVKPVLCSYFHLGRLYNKFITYDKKLQLENVKESLNSYKFLVNYCEKNPDAQNLMAVELSICKDFVKLLPVKIQKLNEEIKNS